MAEEQQQPQQQPVPGQPPQDQPGTLSFNLEDLQKRKLFVATPMYGGMCTGVYAKSLADLTVKCASLKIPLQMFFLFNESLITRARNYCTDEFLRSGATHLMFIDSDIAFNPDDIIALLGLSDDSSEYDVIGGPYPKKCISWEKIKQAVDQGVADQDPNVLERFVGDYVFNPKSNQKSISLGAPCEVREIGTGFMMIRRRTFEKYKEAFPDLSYKPDHIRTTQFDGSREIHAYFDCIIDPESRRYLSEDYMFCYNVQKMGYKVWLCPWMKLAHVGSYTFGGSLADLAMIGASATADPAKIGGKKKP